MNYFWDGYLNGSTELYINVTVNGAVSTLQLVNDTSPSLLIASGKYVLLKIILNISLHMHRMSFKLLSKCTKVVQAGTYAVTGQQAPDSLRLLLSLKSVYVYVCVCS